MPSSYEIMYAVIAIVGSSLVVSQRLRDLAVRFTPRVMTEDVFPAFKFVVCAAVLYATMKALGNHPDHAKVEIAKVEIAKQGGIDAIIKALGNHPDHAGVQQNGCGALGILAINDANKVEIAKQGGIDAIIKALGNQPDQACRQYLWPISPNLTELFSFQAQIEETMIRLFNDDTEITNASMSANFGYLSSDQQTQLYHYMVEKNYLVLVFGAYYIPLPARPRADISPTVQEQCCGALGILAINDDNKVEIAKQGGIDAIIKALGMHPDHAGVQQQGCGALWTLAYNDDNKVEIAKQGGIDAIIKALDNHPDLAGVQQNGCKALTNLASNDDIKQEIMKKGGKKYLKYFK